MIPYLFRAEPDYFTAKQQKKSFFQSMSEDTLATAGIATLNSICIPFETNPAAKSLCYIVATIGFGVFFKYNPKAKNISSLFQRVYPLNENERDSLIQRVENYITRENKFTTCREILQSMNETITKKASIFPNLSVSMDLTIFRFDLNSNAIKDFLSLEDLLVPFTLLPKKETFQLELDALKKALVCYRIKHVPFTNSEIKRPSLKGYMNVIYRAEDKSEALTNLQEVLDKIAFLKSKIQTVETKEAIILLPLLDRMQKILQELPWIHKHKWMELVKNLMQPTGNIRFLPIESGSDHDGKR